MRYGQRELDEWVRKRELRHGFLKNSCVACLRSLGRPVAPPRYSFGGGGRRHGQPRQHEEKQSRDTTPPADPKKDKSGKFCPAGRPLIADEVWAASTGIPLQLKPPPGAKGSITPPLRMDNFTGMLIREPKGHVEMDPSTPRGTPKSFDISVGDRVIKQAKLLRKRLLFGDDGRLAGSCTKKGLDMRYPGIVQLKRWILNEDWKAFRARPFVAWLMPVPYPNPACKDDPAEFIADKAVVRQLWRDEMYMTGYKQAVEVTCLSFGFEISSYGEALSPVREVLNPDRLQQWTADLDSFKLRHALISTELFGETALRQRLIEVAKQLTSSGRLNLDEDGFGEAKCYMGMVEAKNWWNRMLEKWGQPPTLREVLKRAQKDTKDYNAHHIGQGRENPTHGMPMASCRPTPSWYYAPHGSSIF